jgi:glycosyltransferase involved in cell wall biosynthesis
MTVDYERFINNNSKIEETSRYIAFCGYLGWNAEGINKDGVPTLIESFKIVSEKIKDVKLYIIGFTLFQSEFNVLKKLVSDLDLNDKVVFTGQINNKLIPKYLCGASLLVLSRPKSLQAQGGFPTKLGEYLVTGNPVVVTKVGEIEDYLTDGYDSYLAEADSVDSFSEKMIDALNNIEQSRMIGLKGKENALKNFNYLTQAESVIRFIESMKNNRGKETNEDSGFVGNKIKFL